MSRCENHELAISGLIDGEVEAGSVLATVEHLMECAACARFFREARRVETLIRPLRSSRTTRVARLAVSPAPRARAAARWTAAVAAVLLLGLALGRLGDGSTLDLRPAREPGIVHGGKMSDDRFVEVAMELLGADTRDRIEMLQVLQHVEDWSTEESPGQTAALRPDFDLSPRWDQLPLSGEDSFTRGVY